MSQEKNLELARLTFNHTVTELAWMVDDDRAVSLLLTAALDLLTASGLTREQAADHLHLHASTLHQTEIQRLRDGGLLLT